MDLAVSGLQMAQSWGYSMAHSLGHIYLLCGSLVTPAAKKSVALKKSGGAWAVTQGQSTGLVWTRHHKEREGGEKRGRGKGGGTEHQTR